ncbi:MAG: hypothetical protein JEZ07_19800 [Phycisphaerae bacterium]|nr:hypothetical protein [Phycisphaerae bacterium]
MRSLKNLRIRLVMLILGGLCMFAGCSGCDGLSGAAVGAAAVKSLDAMAASAQAKNAELIIAIQEKESQLIDINAEADKLTAELAAIDPADSAAIGRLTEAVNNAKVNLNQTVADLIELDNDRIRNDAAIAAADATHAAIDNKGSSDWTVWAVGLAGTVTALWQRKQKLDEAAKLASKEVDVARVYGDMRNMSTIIENGRSNTFKLENALADTSLKYKAHKQGVEEFKLANIEKAADLYDKIGKARVAVGVDKPISS